MRCCVCANSVFVKGTGVCVKERPSSIPWARVDMYLPTGTTTVVRDLESGFVVSPTRLSQRALGFENFMLYFGYDAASTQALRH